MCDQERLPAAEPEDEALVTRAFVIVGDEPRYESRVFDPAPRIAFPVAGLDRDFTPSSTEPS
jgi:hypothetical protein